MKEKVYDSCTDSSDEEVSKTIDNQLFKNFEYTHEHKNFTQPKLGIVNKKVP